MSGRQFAHVHLENRLNLMFCPIFDLLDKPNDMLLHPNWAHTSIKPSGVSSGSPDCILKPWSSPSSAINTDRNEGELTLSSKNKSLHECDSSSHRLDCYMNWSTSIGGP